MLSIAIIVALDSYQLIFAISVLPFVADFLLIAAYPPYMNETPATKQDAAASSAASTLLGLLSKRLGREKGEELYEAIRLVHEESRVWVGICGGFVLICGILLYTGGLVWTDKIEQLEIAQTRVIDMNAEPVQKDSKPKY